MPRYGKMASGSNLKSFLHSASGTAFVRFILFAAVLAAGIAWGVHWLSLQWFTDDKRQEAVTALQLVDAFVADYADVRAKLAMGDAPVPASFRAHAIQRFNAERLADDSLRLHAVGRKERAIATPPMDAAMAETIEEFARDPAPRASFVPLGDALMFRIVSPSLATQQSCVDCHNKLQPAGTPWRLGDVMGAFFVDVPASQFLARNRAESVALGLALFLALGGAALFVALLHFRSSAPATASAGSWRRASSASATSRKRAPTGSGSRTRTSASSQCRTPRTARACRSCSAAPPKSC